MNVEIYLLCRYCCGKKRNWMNMNRKIWEILKKGNLDIIIWGKIVSFWEEKSRNIKITIHEIKEIYDIDFNSQLNYCSQRFIPRLICLQEIISESYCLLIKFHIISRVIIRVILVYATYLYNIMRHLMP